MTTNVNGWDIALLSQEGSVIAKQSHEGWFQSGSTPRGIRFAIPLPS